MHIGASVMSAKEQGLAPCLGLGGFACAWCMVAGSVVVIPFPSYLQSTRTTLGWDMLRCSSENTSTMILTTGAWEGVRQRCNEKATSTHKPGFRLPRGEGWRSSLMWRSLAETLRVSMTRISAFQTELILLCPSPLLEHDRLARGCACTFACRAGTPWPIAITWFRDGSDLARGALLDLFNLAVQRLAFLEQLRLLGLQPGRVSALH
jgi:hypothetical protein